MIRVERKEEPADFDREVRVPGNHFVSQNPGKEPRKFWNKCREDLYKAYGGYCAYTTFKINCRLDAVVDHFLPQSLHPELRYEWSNYRLASFHINSVKKDAEPIFDPFELPEDAFRLAEDMSIVVNPGAFPSEEDLALANETLRRLKLNCPELIADRMEMRDEALRLIEEGMSEEAALIVSKQLLEQSRFLHREAVRKGYVKPL